MKRKQTGTNPSNVVAAAFQRNLKLRRHVAVELPEFLIYALEARVEEANAGAAPVSRATLSEYIEHELVNLVTVRDVAELEVRSPGFAEAVNHWLSQLRT